MGLVCCIEAQKAMPDQMHTDAHPNAPILLTQLLEKFLKNFRKSEIKWREIKRES